MDIEDIVDTEDFRKSKKKLNEFLIDEMNKYADSKLINYMYSVFGDEKIARKWFYSEHFLLKQRPYDCCKKGKSDLVRTELNAIEHGLCA
jgi:hypothetical protein